MLTWIQAADVAVVWSVTRGRAEEEPYSRPLDMPKTLSYIKNGEIITFVYVIVYVYI